MTEDIFPITLVLGYGSLVFVLYALHVYYVLLCVSLLLMRIFGISLEDSTCQVNYVNRL